MAVLLQNSQVVLPQPATFTKATASLRMSTTGTLTLQMATTGTVTKAVVIPGTVTPAMVTVLVYTALMVTTATDKMVKDIQLDDASFLRLLQVKTPLLQHTVYFNKK